MREINVLPRESYHGIFICGTFGLLTPHDVHTSQRDVCKPQHDVVITPCDVHVYHTPRDNKTSWWRDYVYNTDIYMMVIIENRLLCLGLMHVVIDYC